MRYENEPRFTKVPISASMTETFVDISTEKDGFRLIGHSPVARLK